MTRQNLETWLSNCLLFARGMLRRYGGRLTAQKSRYGWWWHFTWIDKHGTEWSFDPLRPKRRRWFAPPIFRGRVERVGPVKPEDLPEECRDELTPWCGVAPQCRIHPDQPCPRHTEE